MPKSLPPPAFLRKICSRAEAPARIGQLPKPLVFTNGVFDLIHPGHVRYLAQARTLGESLVVALNTDASARRLGKGDDRPINGEHDRAVMLAALESVSLVTWFDEDTPLALIKVLRPDWIIKGGDYAMAQLPETKLVEGYGGQAQAIPLLTGYSTTALVARLRK
ncbi:MAG: adenylyltransferase/cytidyltransferase family protein [Burkholderiaceae bacterium]